MRPCRVCSSASAPYAAALNLSSLSALSSSWLGEVVLIGEGVQETEGHVRRRQVRRQGERAQRGLARRFDVLRVALLGELQEVGAPEVRERGRELRVLRNDLLEQRNRRFERLRPVVVRQQVVRTPVVLLLASHRRP